MQPHLWLPHPPAATLGRPRYTSLAGKKLNSILKKVKAATEEHKSHEVSEESHTGNAFHSSCLTELEAIKEIFRCAINSNKRHDAEDRTTFRVTLDDAEEVLSNVETE
ncbi:unnamed protein product [Agarophyton chilense]